MKQALLAVVQVWLDRLQSMAVVVSLLSSFDCASSMIFPFGRSLAGSGGRCCLSTSSAESEGQLHVVLQEKPMDKHDMFSGGLST